MSEILTTMARRAERSETLLASHIRDYADRHDMDWAGVAHQLAITSNQLSKLALCRAPRRDRYAEDVDRIAEYVDIEPATLAWFLESAVSLPRGGVRTAPQNGGAARRETGTRPAPVFSLRRLGLAVAFLALAAFLGAFVLTGTRQASAATLVVNQGEATLISESRTLLLFTHQDEMQIVSGGTIAVSTGDAIGVPLDGSATLRLSDGSTIDLDGGTVVEISELATTGESYRVRLNMLAGRTVNRVRRVLGAGDAFEIGTPSSTASVRGTVFTVEVIDDETTRVAVSEGTVWFEMDGETVELHEGDEITGQRGQPLTLTETPTAEPTTAEPTTASQATAAPTETPPAPTPTPIPTITTAEPQQELAPSLIGDTQEPTVESAATQPPAVVPPPADPTDPPPANSTDPPPADPTDPPPADPTDPPPADPTDPPDDGSNPNDDKDGVPDDGNAGIGNDEDKDENPDDGNNGIGNDEDKDDNPDDGNNGSGDDDKPDDGNNGSGNDDKDK